MDFLLDAFLTHGAAIVAAIVLVLIPSPGNKIINFIIAVLTKMKETKKK